jgi:hypothetical protein
MSIPTSDLGGVDKVGLFAYDATTGLFKAVQVDSTGAIDTDSIASSGYPPVVNLTTSSDVQDALDSNPPGTIFLFAPGDYAIPDQDGYVPQDEQQLIGDGLGVNLIGAKTLTGWTQSGSAWWASAFLPAAADGHGFCTADGENGLCTERQDVFFDDARLTRVGTQGAVATGKFWTDYTNNRVYIGDDPTGHTVEQAWNNFAVSGNAVGVRVQNFVIEKFANDSQEGAIHPGDGASGWTIAYNESRYNHGAGIHGGNGLGGRHVLLRNSVHHNGQIGMSSNGLNVQVLYNEIYENRTLDFDVLWEGGGTKFGYSDYLHLRGNYVHDNHGPGLWTDISNGYSLVEDNYVRDNDGYGIFHEISYQAVIRNNTSVDNADGTNNTSFYEGGQIVVSASPDVEVYGNVVRGREGIGGLQQARTDHPDLRGAHEVWNLNIHDNQIELTAGTDEVIAGIVCDDATQKPAVWDSRNNTFTDNAYFAPTSSGQYWDWADAVITFTAWQAEGMDTGGSITVGTLSIPSPPSLVVGPQA